ncbi:DUF7504 family protein [Halorubrum trueperi]|uniref:DUF835 domain-containing protein n=1 Tax=Halorubrum trueperi TaxID=2004704 RepID=A0ABD5UHU5_9EURY
MSDDGADDSRQEETDPDGSGHSPDRRSRFEALWTRFEDDRDGRSRNPDDPRDGTTGGSTGTSTDDSDRDPDTDGTSTDDSIDGTSTADPNSDDAVIAREPAGTEGRTDEVDSWEWLADGRPGRENPSESEESEESEEREASEGPPDWSRQTDRSDAVSEPPQSDAEPSPSASDRRRAGRGEGRIWDRERSTTDGSLDRGAIASDDTATESNRSIDSPSPGSFSEDAPEHVDGGLPSGVSVAPGTSVLVQSESRDDRSKHACHALLYDERDGTVPYTLLVRYQELDPSRLERLAEGSHRLKLIAIGYGQSVPASVDDAVDCVRITNPNDITRLGIVLSGTIADWSDDDRPIAVCFDSLNVVLNYRDVKSTFRFLHVLLNTLRSADTVSHFHVDPIAGDPQDVNTLKPLFDEVVAIDSVGVHRE